MIVVEVEEEPKKRSASAPPLDDEAGVGDVGERSRSPESSHRSCQKSP